MEGRWGRSRHGKHCDKVELFVLTYKEVLLPFLTDRGEYYLLKVGVIAGAHR